MAYYDLTVTLEKLYVDDVADFAASLGNSGLYIEDLSDIESILGYSSEFDYIDDSLLNDEKKAAVIHLYPSGSEDAEEMKASICRFCSDKNIAAKVSLEEKKEEDWETSWQDRYEKVFAGKFEVLPFWEESTDSELIPLRIDTTEAYGSGQSVNTQLCLEAISDIELKDMRILDMGTGTGILGIAALLKGADSVLGLDIDPYSIENSRENADNNNVGDRFEARMRTSRTTDRLTEEYDAVFAHITADVIIEDAELYSRILKRDGFLLVGGIVSDRKSEVVSELEKKGFSDFVFYEREEWVTLVCRKTQI
ncbi:MAG: 50S ribosomal protein L11 methyltransferase [Oscillospiraceae bacterium]|nr:50S ribosomal protein L11 methyltransferase [Oscillospiraceae bacterium]